jgi:integrase
VLTLVGATKAGLGVTPHGLRHQFAEDLSFDLTGLDAPARGGAPEHDPALRQAVYLEVARQLGHGRPRISGAHLGECNGRGGNKD